MKLKPGYEKEYKRRNDEIWPELEQELRKAGISDYTIFLDEETSTLFAVQKLSDDNCADRLPESPVVRKWWDYMSEIMEYNANGTPVSIPLKEVSHMP